MASRDTISMTKQSGLSSFWANAAQREFSDKPPSLEGEGSHFAWSLSAGSRWKGAAVFLSKSLAKYHTYGGYMEFQITEHEFDGGGIYIEAVCYLCEKRFEVGPTIFRLSKREQKDDYFEMAGNICGQCATAHPDEFRGMWRATVRRTEREIMAVQFKRARLVEKRELLDGLLAEVDMGIEDCDDKIAKYREINRDMTAWADYAEIYVPLVSGPKPLQDGTDFLDDILCGGEFEAKDGYIYVLASADGHYKIGRTRDVPSRVNALKIQLPYEVELLETYYVIDCVRAERLLHEHFADRRMNGEWFRLSETDIEWLKGLKRRDNQIREIEPGESKEASS
jgi:Meiotically up-regulated gene 113